ncbi:MULTISPECIES: DUF6423 family protein [unclassified Streptomyces]|uniref:DUF6423 family protein n=2 Tax=unclassified Streptomyces TaxID=2593676 RepID=UPI00331B61ED
MTLSVPGLDVQTRVRARDIQMAASADLERRVLMISGAIDTKEHDIAVSFELPDAGRWQVIKSESNLTDAPWLTWQMTAGEGTRFVNDADAMVVSRQFAKTFMTPDQSRIMFYDGEVRPGEAVLKMFTIECATRRGKVSHSRFQPPPTESPKKVNGLIEEYVANGMPPKPVIEVVVPVTLIG